MARRSNPQAKRAMQLYQSGRAHSLKQAWSMVKGGARSAGRGHRSKGHHSIRKADPPGSKHEKIGAAYLNAKMGVQVAAPVINVGSALALKQISGTPTSLAHELKGNILNAGYGESLVSSVAQRYADKKLRIANAISRGSATAILSEAVPIVQTYQDVRGAGKGALQHAPARFNAHTTGYDSATQTFDLKDATPYLVTKYGTALVRKHAPDAVKKPVSKFLNSVGLSA